MGAAAEWCQPERSTPAHPPAGGAQQSISVVVPTIAIIEVLDGAPSRAWTNSGRPPAAGDRLYFRDSDRLTEATPAMHGDVLGAAWLPVTGDRYRPELWVLATGS